MYTWPIPPIPSHRRQTHVLHTERARRSWYYFAGSEGPDFLSPPSAGPRILVCITHSQNLQFHSMCDIITVTPCLQTSSLCTRKIWKRWNDGRKERRQKRKIKVKWRIKTRLKCGVGSLWRTWKKQGWKWKRWVHVLRVNISRRSDIGNIDSTSVHHHVWNHIVCIDLSSVTHM